MASRPTGLDRRPAIVLFEAVNLVLTRAVFRWTGLPLDDARGMTHQMSSMIENSGRIGPRMWLALARRTRTEAHVRPAVRRARVAHTAEPTPLQQHRAVSRCG